MAKSPLCKRKHDLIGVWWVDAEQQAGWSEDREDDPIHVMCTYGLLIRRDKVFIHLADTHLGDNVWGGRNKIPKAWVRKVEIMAKNAQCHYFEDHK